MTPSGGRAAGNGRRLEHVVRQSFETAGFPVLKETTWRDLTRRGRAPAEALLTNVEYTTIYGTTGRTEFALQSDRFPGGLRIECKWQQSSGSVDEKFPYVLLNCVEQMPERVIIILVDGGGARREAVTWLRHAAQAVQTRWDTARAADTPRRELHVMNVGEFLGWFNIQFPSGG